MNEYEILSLILGYFNLMLNVFKLFFHNKK